MEASDRAQAGIVAQDSSRQVLADIQTVADNMVLLVFSLVFSLGILFGKESDTVSD